MGIEWTSDLAVGVSEIDKQHQEIFRKINNLLDACNQGKGKTVVADVIDFLGNYVVEHFGAEEKLMQQYNYPGYAQHKQMHDDFIKTYTALKESYERDGLAVNVVIQTNKTVVRWLNDHIRNVDKQLGKFLSEQKK